MTGARTKLPITALPLTVDVVGGKELDQPGRDFRLGHRCGLGAGFPAFSPTREKLSGAGETLRGRSPLFAINGVPQSTPIRDGSRDGYTIDPFFIDRVEVIYGSNALQGIGATGGVVNQVTVGPPRRGRRQRANADPGDRPGRDFDGEALGGKVAGLAGYRSGAFDVTGGAAFETRGIFLDGDGRRIGIDGTQGDIQDSDSWSMFGRLRLADRADRPARTDRQPLRARRARPLCHRQRQPADRPTTTSVKGDPAGEPPANRAELLSAPSPNPTFSAGS